MGKIRVSRAAPGVLGSPGAAVFPNLLGSSSHAARSLEHHCFNGRPGTQVEFSRECPPLCSPEFRDGG